MYDRGVLKGLACFLNVQQKVFRGTLIFTTSLALINIMGGWTDIIVLMHIKFKIGERKGRRYSGRGVRGGGRLRAALIV